MSDKGADLHAVTLVVHFVYMLSRLPDWLVLRICTSCKHSL